MAESRSHKITARRIAKRHGLRYNAAKGADIKAPGITIEVETPETVRDAPRQLQGHRGPAYIAGTNKEAVEKALKVAKGTTIGVMDNQGNIKKPSTRVANPVDSIAAMYKKSTVSDRRLKKYRGRD